jgi:hypothetical protein
VQQAGQLWRLGISCRHRRKLQLQQRQWLRVLLQHHLPLCLQEPDHDQPAPVDATAASAGSCLLLEEHLLFAAACSWNLLMEAL